MSRTTLQNLHKFRLSSVILVALCDDHIELTKVKTREQFRSVAALPPQYNGRSDWDDEQRNNGRNHLPFAHPRTPVTNSRAATEVLRNVLMQSQFSPTPPILIIRPQTRFLNDITDVELNTLRDVALKAGAAQVHMYLKPEFAESDWGYFESL
ncbi:MAG: hypothetical protein Q4E77_02220 [Conchiformibius sp.]|nr:hypothetical protein [Conchiformibius sp.]